MIGLPSHGLIQVSQLSAIGRASRPQGDFAQIRLLTPEGLPPLP